VVLGLVGPFVVLSKVRECAILRFGVQELSHGAHHLGLGSVLDMVLDKERILRSTTLLFAAQISWQPVRTTVVELGLEWLILDWGLPKSMLWRFGSQEWSQAVATRVPALEVECHQALGHSRLLELC
jgi:hypothetical protein